MGKWESEDKRSKEEELRIEDEPKRKIRRKGEEKRWKKVRIKV